MPVHLSKREVVTIEVLAEKGQGVMEGTVRYHLRRAANRGR